MNDESLLRLIEFLSEAIEREGPEFSPESLLSSIKLLLELSAPPKPPTPVERHVLATDRHIQELCGERDRMVRELAAVREALALEIKAHRARLDWFEPEYEGLKRDYDTIRSLNFSSLVMITGGGVLIGAASFITGDVLKFSTLAAGTIANVYGLWTQGLIVSKSPASKERPGI
jgi:hypothetical protein